MPLAARRLLSSRWVEPVGVAVVVGLVLAGSIAEAYPAHHYAGLHLRHHPFPALFAVLVVPAALLWWRRSYPVAVYLATVAGAAWWAASGEVYGAALVMVLVALYALAVSGQRWPVVAELGAGGTLVIWLAGGLGGPWGWWGGPQLDMWAEMVAAGAVGGYVSARHRWAHSEQLRREQLERARAEEIRQQVTAERLRIARELHDVVAHSMAMINVQATAASTLVGTDPAGVTDSLQAIRSASKDGLRELRSILDVLRQVDEPQLAVPLPDGHGLQALAEAARAAGVRLGFHCDADLQAAAPGTALAVHRIVQESLTNVVRHASGATAEVSVTGGRGRILVDVVDDGGSGGAPFVEGTGSGLAGMAERARAIGGRLEAGPRPGGGWRVHADLPAAPARHDADPATPATLLGS